MLTSQLQRRSSADLSFFSSSKSSSPTVSSCCRLPPQRSSSSAPAHYSSLPPSSPPSTSRSSPLSSPPSPPPPRKRKSLADDSLHPPTALPREVKRLRTASGSGNPRKRKYATSSASSSRAVSRTRLLAPEPEPIYRSSRSRSTSTFPAWDQETPQDRPKRCWYAEHDFDSTQHHISSETVVKRLMKSYKSYFKNLADPTDTSFEPHPTNYPCVELEYPNSGATERFVLLAPKDKDHYNPIMDLEKSLFTIIEYYLTPEQQALFGPIPSETLSEAVSPPPSPSPSPPNSSSSSTASTSSLSSLDSESSSLISLSWLSSPSGPPLPLLRAVQRAIHMQDGPLFIRAMTRINKILHSLKYPAVPADLYGPTPCNSLKQAVRSWTETGMPKKVLMRIIEENYQRSVGPNVPSLKRYEAFSSTVYGELLPSLSHEIIRITKLKEDSLFLDLGSGVGNVVVQASLQTGCTSFGIELMQHPARIARDMVEQVKVRCQLWGIRIGEMELEEGNMLTSKRVDELITKADVLLVDNKVFEESLNEALRPKFLDLKEGAIVVSLKPFVSSLNARVTERNVDDISAIFDVTERPYHSGSVSWGNSGGTYYLHRVDREGYAKIRERFENSRAGGRNTRTRK